MNYEEFMDLAKKIIEQYNEGAILAEEGFNAIVSRATQVEITENIKDEENVES